MLGVVTSLVVAGDELVLHLTPGQKIAALHSDLRVPLSGVRSVGVMEKPWMQLRGRRMAGVGFPGSVAMGTWIHAGGLDFCLLRRTQPAVAVDLSAGRFSRWVVGVPPGADARALAGRIADAAGIAGP